MKTDTEDGGSATKTASVVIVLLFGMCLAVLAACGGEAVPTAEPSPSATAEERWVPERPPASEG